MKCFPRRDEIPFLPFSGERKNVSRHLLRLLFPVFHVNGYSNCNAKYFFILFKKNNNILIFNLFYCHEISKKPEEPSESPSVFPPREFFRPGGSMTHGQKRRQPGEMRCSGAPGTACVRRRRNIRAISHLKVFMPMTYRNFTFPSRIFRQTSSTVCSWWKSGSRARLRTGKSHAYKRTRR